LNQKKSIFRRDVLSWSLYDFANTIFSMNILSLYFKRWVVEDLGRDGLYYDAAYSLSMLTVGLIMPALGALSDYSTKKKLFLFLFTIFCCVSIGIFAVTPVSFFLLIIIFFAIANFFYEGGMVFYNALLYSVSDGKEARLVSGLGVALGYTGSIVGMILVLPWVEGAIFGLDIPWLGAGGKTAAFLPTAVMFLVFSIPLFLWVKESNLPIKEGRVNIRGAYRDVWEGIRATKKYPGVLRFLIADYFFEDAVATVILNMGIFSSFVLGFGDSEITVFLIISTFSAMVGSFVIGKISQYISLKRMMVGIIWGWIAALLLFILIDNRIIIYFLGSIMGIFLGGLWTVSRPLLAEMVPKKELGRFFGLYSLSGKAAAVVGPVIWGIIVFSFSSAYYLGTERNFEEVVAAIAAGETASIEIQLKNQTENNDIEFELVEYDEDIFNVVPDTGTIPYKESLDLTLSINPSNITDTLSVSDTLYINWGRAGSDKDSSAAIPIEIMFGQMASAPEIPVIEFKNIVTEMNSLAGLFGLTEEGAIKLPYKLAVLSLILMMITGLIIFRKVPDKERERAD